MQVKTIVYNYKIYIIHFLLRPMFNFNIFFSLYITNSLANINKAISNMLLFRFTFFIYFYFHIEENEIKTIIMSFISSNKFTLTQYRNCFFKNFFLDIEQIQCSGVFILPKCICSFHHVSNPIYHNYTACPFNSKNDDLDHLSCK